MPITARKRIANIENARKSTGPRTPEGKEVAAQNSTKHGAFSKALVLPGENIEEYHALLAGLVTDLKPVGVLEYTLTEKIAISLWRSRRLLLWETFEEYPNAYKRSQGQLPEPFNVKLNPQLQDRLARLHAAVDGSTYRALKVLQQVQASRLESIDSIAVEE